MAWTRKLMCALWVLEMISPVAPLTDYGSCASVWIARWVGSSKCLPPITDCMCYADAFYLEQAAIDIAGKCTDANALQETADTLTSNCQELNQTPQLDGAQFSAAGRSIAADTIYSPATSFDPGTVPAAPTTSGVASATTSSVESVITSFTGETFISGPTGTLTAHGSLSLGPATLPSSSSTAAPVTSTSSKALGVSYRDGSDRFSELVAGLGGLLLSLYGL